MAPLTITPRCHVCREPASVTEYGKYYCGDCFLAHTRNLMAVPLLPRDAGEKVAKANKRA